MFDISDKNFKAVFMKMLQQSVFLKEIKVRNVSVKTYNL